MSLTKLENVCIVELQAIAAAYDKVDAAFRLKSPMYALSEISILFRNLSYRSGNDFFLGVLRSFSMVSKERKVVEAGARYFGLKRGKKLFKLPRGTTDISGAVAGAKKYLDEIASFYQTACTVIKRGEACTDDQFCTASCFRLVNTGGFDAAKMRAVQTVVDQAAKILDRGGFGRFCYGDVNVSQTVLRSSRILAFYMPGKDDLYVRANLKGVEGAALHTVLHEIGHRVDHVGIRKMPEPGRSKVSRMVNTLFYESTRAAREEPTVEGGKPPAIGDEFVWKGQPFKVTNIIAGKVHLRIEGMAGSISMPVETWLIKHGGKPAQSKYFPTAYSRTKVGEFFAEMFSFYLQNQLGPEQRKAFAPIMEALALEAAPVAAAAGMTRGRAKRRASQ